MSTSLETAIRRYLRARNLSSGSRDSYFTTLRKWNEWKGGVSLEELRRQHIRDFLDWVHERAVEDEGSNPGRTANKARENLRAVMSWAWEHDILETLPRFPKPKKQRDVAGRHYLTKEEINALYFATHKMKRPRGWDQLIPVGRYWRCALVMFYNYGVDTGTVWKCAPFHEPLRWRHVSWDSESPNRQIKERSRWGWSFYRRVKTGKAFYRPMNRAVHSHIKSIMPEHIRPNEPVFHGGGSRPNSRFQQLCSLAEIAPKTNVETGEETLWLLKDLRKTCATYYDEHVPESPIEILGHSVAGVTYRHYAHRGPLAFKAIMTIRQPSAFSAMIKGFDGECPCCRRRFNDGS